MRSEGVERRRLGDVSLHVRTDGRLQLKKRHSGRRSNVVAITTLAFTTLTTRQQVVVGGELAVLLVELILRPGIRGLLHDHRRARLSCLVRPRSAIPPAKLRKP